MHLPCFLYSPLCPDNPAAICEKNRKHTLLRPSAVHDSRTFQRIFMRQRGKCARIEPSLPNDWRFHHEKDSSHPHARLRALPDELQRSLCRTAAGNAAPDALGRRPGHGHGGAGHGDRHDWRDDAGQGCSQGTERQCLGIEPDPGSCPRPRHRGERHPDAQLLLLPKLQHG